MKNLKHKFLYNNIFLLRNKYSNPIFSATSSHFSMQQIKHNSSGVAAEENSEIFDILNDKGNVIGQEKRSIVHANGLWHAAVYCFIFNSNKELLLQKRSLEKKVGPGQWDLSVAEHLSSGESYPTAVMRGLKEELGIENVNPCDLMGPLTPRHQRSLPLHHIGIIDNEFVESYCLNNYDGAVCYNNLEVSEVRFLPLRNIREEMSKNPDTFTDWFRDEIALLNWFET